MILRRTALVLLLVVSFVSTSRPGSSTAQNAAASLDVVFSEVAWSGMPADYNDEWIELYNNTAADVDLSGWRLFTSGTPDATLTGIIPASGYYLLERTDDASVPDRTADQTYTGALYNSPGEVITLTDSFSNVVDIVGLDPSGDWWAGASSPERLPMVRVMLTASGVLNTSWASGVISGTPANSIVDDDGDTYGYSPNVDWTAGDGAGYEVRDEDCDDGNVTVYPGAAESLNLLDDDCNGWIDDGLDLGAFEWSVHFNSGATIDALGTTTTTAAMEQALIGYIEAATETVDAAIYGLDRGSLVDALIDAHNRGVQVRVVGDDEAASGYYSPAYNLLSSNGIPVVVDSSSRLEHNKFAVFDGQTVWTGSTNWTDTGLTYNANNSIVITSPSLALAYTAEFEEMFGGAFHTTKSDNTTHVFSYTETIVESYFSPSDGVQARVTEVLSNAQESIYFVLFYWTADDVADLVVSKVVSEGLSVSGVWDAVGAKNPYSEDEKLCAAGVPLKVETFGGKAHHKFAVVDVGGDAPVVITGSYNWTAAGDEDNDENTLIIHDRAVAQAYYQEYLRLYDALPDATICSNHSAESSLAACQDGLDNDYDGYVDGADWDCRESTPAACGDGADNDGDGDTDLDDLDCYKCLLMGVSVHGPGVVSPGQALTLTALLSPTDAAGPLSYAWSADGLRTDITDTAVYSWPLAGVHGVAVTATNQCRDVTGVFTVSVRAELVAGFDRPVYTVTEDVGVAVITVTLDAAPATLATVDYATGGGTAAAGSDYEAVSGTLTFASSVTALTFTVPISDDALIEGDETITLTLSNPRTAGIEAGSATLTILDDDWGVYLPLVMRDWVE